MRTQPAPGPLLSAVGVIAGFASLAIGIGLVTRNHDDLFNLVWSSFPVILGLIILLSHAALFLGKRFPPRTAASRKVRFENQKARFLPRRREPGASGGFIVLVLLGGWFLAMGVVGAVEENWAWPVLAAFPAAYFLGIPVLIVARLFRPGGVWLTPTKIVNEQYGLRSEIAIGDVETAVPLIDEVRIVPADPSAVHHKRRTPRLWCARLVPGEMAVLAEGIEGGVDGFAAEIRRRAVAAKDAGRKKRWPWG